MFSSVFDVPADFEGRIAVLAAFYCVSQAKKMAFEEIFCPLNIIVLTLKIALLGRFRHLPGFSGHFFPWLSEICFRKLTSKACKIE